MKDEIKLDEIPGLKEIGYSELPCYSYNDHRWILCMIYYGQQSKFINSPTTLITFDAHHDALEPRCIDKIKILRQNGIKFRDVSRLCGTFLSINDDDWVIAGMELGLIKDYVVMGVQGSRDVMYDNHIYILIIWSALIK